MQQKTYKTVLFSAVLLYHCSGTQADRPVEMSGEFNLLTYNVAGLPQGISPSNPKHNTPIISAKLNDFDLALVQEDFLYHNELKFAARHAYQSETQINCAPHFVGDGLNRFSVFPFDELHREEWVDCSNEKGNDCLAAKGFSVARTELASGVFVDIYNVHLDSGGSASDLQARRSQVGQLLKMLNSHSVGNAVIIVGDLNLNIRLRPGDIEILENLLRDAGLSDACRALSCDMELVDKVLFRSGDALALKAISWQVEEGFEDENGQPLSDHSAIGVRFQWQLSKPDALTQYP